jgi:transcriptional regulator with XRE-family HTH domain
MATTFPSNMSNVLRMSRGRYTTAEKLAFGERVTILAKENYLNASDIGRKVGVTRRMAGLWMHGTSVPGPPNDDKLATLLGTTRQYLLYGSDSAVGERRSVAVVSESGVGSDFVSLPVLNSLIQADSDGTLLVLPSNEREHFSRRQLERAGLDPDATDRLFCYDLLDDSMAPDIPRGAPVVIDRGSTTVTDGQIYAIDRSGLEQIRRLYRTVDGYRIEAVNSDRYPMETADKEAITIIGRVALWISTVSGYNPRVG